MYKREHRTNDQIVAAVVRATDEPMLKCGDCLKQFQPHETIVIDIGNEVDGIIIFHQEEDACYRGVLGR